MEAVVEVPLGTVVSTSRQQVHPMTREKAWVDCPSCGTQPIPSLTYVLEYVKVRFGTRSRVAARVASCPLCGNEAKARMIADTFKSNLGRRERHECNAICMSATGFSCECRCEGKNHGAGGA